MNDVHYLESQGLKVVPVYEDSKPIKFLVVNPKGITVAESNMLYKAENFIMGSHKFEKGPAVDAMAEIPTL